MDTAQSLAARVDELMHQAKLDRKEALKLAAKERGITKRDAYRQLLGENRAGSVRRLVERLKVTSSTQE